MWYVYLSLTLWWAPQPTVEVEAGPGVYGAVGVQAVDFEPLTLTWSPEEGFGARSRMQVLRDPYLAEE